MVDFQGAGHNFNCFDYIYIYNILYNHIVPYSRKFSKGLIFKDFEITHYFFKYKSHLALFKHWQC